MLPVVEFENEKVINHHNAPNEHHKNDLEPCHSTPGSSADLEERVWHVGEGRADRSLDLSHMISDSMVPDMGWGTIKGCRLLCKPQIRRRVVKPWSFDLRAIPDKSSPATSCMQHLLSSCMAAACIGCEPISQLGPLFNNMIEVLCEDFALAIIT